MFLTHLLLIPFEIDYFPNLFQICDLATPHDQFIGYVSKRWGQRSIIQVGLTRKDFMMMLTGRE